MSRYIKAGLALNHTIIYLDDEGRYFRFSGGTWAWRNHNPGNLYPDGISAKHNQIGRAKVSKNQCFAIFPDYENGHAALLDCLKTTYGESSIEDMVEAYAPKEGGNDVEKYRKFLHKETGIYDNKKVKDFTQDEFDKLWRAIEKIEGYKEGVLVEVFPVIQVHKDKKGISDLNVKKKGWLPKPECIELAKQGLLDLVICTSHAGHEYLRARKGSPVNGSLDKLVVKGRNKERNQALTMNIISADRENKEKVENLICKKY